MKRFVILGAMMLVSNVSLVCTMHNMADAQAAAEQAFQGGAICEEEIRV